MWINHLSGGGVRIVASSNYGDDFEFVDSGFTDWRNVRVGDEGCLVIKGGNEQYHKGFLFNDRAGYPGNSNPKVWRLHGWRGTTNDVCVYAYGWRRVETIKRYKRGCRYSVILSPDLMPDNQ